MNVMAVMFVMQLYLSWATEAVYVKKVNQSQIRSLSNFQHTKSQFWMSLKI